VSVPLLGCDFSSTPTRRKPIVLALGQEAGASPATARPLSGQQASGALASGAAITPADSHGRQLSN
jgi:hypothetical protein